MTFDGWASQVEISEDGGKTWKPIAGILIGSPSADEQKPKPELTPTTESKK